MNYRKLTINWFYDTLLKSVNPKSVLDVGCGNGKMQEYFEHRHIRWTGIDLEPTNQSIIKMNFLDSNLKDNSFDLVYSAHVIEHLSLEQVQVFVNECLRVSKKYVCVVTPVFNNKFWDQYDHVRPYNIETLKRVFHVKDTIKTKKIVLPFFEPVNIILFDVSKSTNEVRNK